MKKIILFICIGLLSGLKINAQKILKENLSKKVNFYYDVHRNILESSGFYYVDKVNKNSTIKHGKWMYYSRLGDLEQELNYYKDQLHGAVLYYYPGKRKKEEGYFKMGLQDSIFRQWNEMGKLQVEGNYKDGKPTGIWSYFYLDGRLKSVEEIKDTVSYMLSFYYSDSLHTQTIKDGNGYLEEFYTTGALKSYYPYKNGLKDGAFEERSIYGYLTLSGSFKEGLKDSTWTYAYYTGETEKISNYKAGLLDGPYRYFYDKNRINVEGQYTDGKKTGTWTWYTNKGTRDMQGEFLNDKQHGDWTYWYATGEISYTAHFKEDLKTGQWTYLYKNGTKFKEGSFLEDEKDGIWKTWYENGTLLMEGAYEKGKEKGEWSNYWESGKLKDKSTFKDGKLHGEWISMTPDGKVKSKGEYKEGNKSGEWLIYFDNGKVKDIITYKVFSEKSKMNYGIMKDFKTEESKMHGLYISFSSKDFKKTEEGNYKEGEKDGEWIAYHPGGKFPAVITHYKKGKLDGWMEQYDRRGNIISKTQYKDGLKDGKFLVYNEKGKVIVEKEFKEGMQVIDDPRYQNGSFTPGR